MTDKPKDNKIGWLANTGTLVGITSALSVLLSVLYEYGFYHLGIGIPIPAIPTAMNDHIKACFVWLPLAIGLLILAFTIVVTYKARRGLKNNRENSNVGIAGTIKINKFQPKWISVFLGTITTIIIIFSIVLNWPTKILVVSSVSLLIYILQYFSNDFAEKFIELGRFSSEIHVFSMAFPLIVAILILWGYFDAINQIHAKPYLYEISLKDTSGPKLKANIVRSYDKVTFFVYSSQKLVFIQNDQIKMITK